MQPTLISSVSVPIYSTIYLRVRSFGLFCSPLIELKPVPLFQYDCIFHKGKTMFMSLTSLTICSTVLDMNKYSIITQLFIPFTYAVPTDY